MNRPKTVYPFAYLNGAYLPVEEALLSPLDRGFLLGDGLYETLHIDRGAPIDLDPHFDRLEESADFFGISLPTREALLQIFARVITKNGLASRDASEAALRLTISRGVHRDGPPTLLVHARRLTPGHLAKRDVGVHLHVVPFSGRGDADMARHKSVSHLASALAETWLLERAGWKPVDEGLFVTAGGSVREGHSSNLFAIEGNVLRTPPIEDGLLPGVSRAAMCGLGEDLGYRVSNERLELEELVGADEVFVTSSTLHVAPVVAVDDEPIGSGAPGDGVRAIQRAFEERVVAQVDTWHAQGGWKGRL